MHKYETYLVAGIFAFLLAACSEENPSDVFINHLSSETSSSSIFEESSSSQDFAIYSSSFDTFSSNTEISSSSWEPYSYGELVDERDGQVYKTIKIGEQTWMAENLNYAYSLPTSKKDTSNTNKSDSTDKYGKLYRWSIAMDSAAVFSLDGKGCGRGVNCGSQPSKGVRGVCPENWHIPNESDLENIVNYTNTSNDNHIWIEHYWFLTENEDNEFKKEMKLKYDNFWTSAQIDSDNTKGMGYVNNILTITHSPKGELTDERDGQVYKTVKIGNQWWMAENLNYAYTLPVYDYVYQDSSSFCYNDEPDSCAKYGRLYLWEAAMDCLSKKYSLCNEYSGDDIAAHGICPEKWHIPSVNEWNAMLSITNGFAPDLKSTSGWLNDDNGSDTFGFGLLPAGAGYFEGPWGEWYGIGEITCFWTPAQRTKQLSDLGPISYYERAITFCVTLERKSFDLYDELKTDAYSVRCVKDAETSE